MRLFKRRLDEIFRPVRSAHDDTTRTLYYLEDTTVGSRINIVTSEAPSFVERLFDVDAG